MKSVKRIIKYVWRTMEVIFIVFCVFIGSLFMREQRLPGWALDRLLRRASSANFLIACDDVYFGFRSGVRIVGPKIFNRESVRYPDPVVSARSVEIDLLRRKLRIDALRVPFLHDGYYEDGPSQEKNSPVEFRIPELPSFTLELDRPYVLGVAPEFVTCLVNTALGSLNFADIRLDWPDDGSDMSLRGFCTVSPGRQLVKGEVKGLARQSHIRPLIEVLDVPVALPYMDAFTEVTEPVPAYCGWEVNLVNNDFRMELDLKPTLGRYNGVPLSRVDGKVGLHVYTRGTNLNFNTRIGPLKAWNLDGDPVLDGQLTVRRTNEVTSIDFDAKGHAPPKELTTIIDYLNGGSLDCFETTNAVDVSVFGRLATDLARQRENALGGRLSSPSCRFFGLPFRDAEVDWAYVGDTVAFTNLSVRGPKGGRLSGSAKVHVPGLDEERDSFAIDFRYEDGSFAELADFFGIELSDSHGKAEAALKLSAPLSSNVFANAVASGRIAITEARLWRLEFFDTITKALHIDKVPGVDAIAGLSDSASADFAIAGGVLRTENVVIEGPFVSISAWGSCDLRTGQLDFVVRLQPLRRRIGDGLIPLGELVHLLTLPITKTLEYRVTGTLKEPKWQSRWIDKIVETVKEPK